jgi:hypothetical protein
MDNFPKTQLREATIKINRRAQRPESPKRACSMSDFRRVLFFETLNPNNNNDICEMQPKDCVGPASPWLYHGA